MLGNVILFTSIVLPVLVLLAILFGWKYFFDRDARRSPLNTKIHNTPGEQLRVRLTELDETMLLTYMAAALSGPTLLAAWLFARLRKVDMSALKFGVGDWLFLVILIIVIVTAGLRMIRVGKERRKVQQGLSAEIVIAQHLLPLMGKGCVVFNDIPADKFNLDHVVIGPQAVFMVETKSRKKPAERGKESAKVFYDGQGLKFPNHMETKSLEQARNQARWLSEYLKGAAGEPVKVIPVLALPGWWVEKTKTAIASDVIVTNGKNPAFMLSPNFGANMSESLRNRIAYALTQRYPDPD